MQSDSMSRIARIWRWLFLAAGLFLVLMAIFLPVEMVVSHAISPAIRQQILAKGTPERITFLQNQFRTSLMWFRGVGGVLGVWLLLMGGLFPYLIKWDHDIPSLRPPASPRPRSASHIPHLTFLLPLLWVILTVILSLPIITKGFEHEELLIMDMLAKRGPLVTMACQNQAPRAAQPAYTILEGFAVKAFGDSEAVARAPSVVLGALVMFPLFFIAMRIGGIRLANVACFLTATNGLFLFYINYARGYAFAMTMYISAIYMGLLILDRSSWKRWMIMGGFILVGVYSHMAVGVYVAFVCIVMLVELMGQGGKVAREQGGKGASVFALLRRDKSSQGCKADTQMDDSTPSTIRRSSFMVYRSLLVRPVLVWGTVALTLAWLYSIGVPASLDYLKAFDLTSYYMAYHINLRFLHVMLTLLGGLRMLPLWNWGVLAGGVIGVGVVYRKSRITSLLLAIPLLLAIVLFYVKNLFVYPRYFIFFIPVFCLFFAASVAALMSLAAKKNRRAGYGVSAVIWVVLVGIAVLNLKPLYAMERCGVRTAVEDAKKAMNSGDRIAGVLDGKVTVEHYYPGCVSMFRDTDFWRELNSSNPPEWVINVPYINYDIPGGWDALRKKYDLYRAYPSWLDVVDDQDSVYLYRVKAGK